MSKTNLTILIIFIAGVVIAGGYFLFQVTYQQIPTPTSPEAEVAPRPRSASTGEVKEFTVSGTEYAFNPPSITVEAGERVKINFRNEGNVIHNLFVEGLGVGTKTIRGGQTDTIEFTAPSSGTYAIFCSVPGHRAAGMEGELKIK